MTGVVPNCSKADQIEIAAYAYDLSHAPITNSSLLTVFTTSLTVCLPFPFPPFLFPPSPLPSDFSKYS